MVESDELRQAFESEGYEVSEVTVNRDQVRVVVLDADPDAEDLRSTARDAGGDDILGLDVTSETREGDDGVATAVSFRPRS